MEIDDQLVLNQVKDSMINYKTTKSGLVSVEERAAFESAYVDYVTSLLEKQDTELLPRGAQRPTLDAFKSAYANYTKLENRANTATGILVDRYLATHNSKLIQLMSVKNAVKRIKQKSAVLDLWLGNQVHGMQVSKFKDFRSLSDKDLKYELVHLDFQQGLVTLPHKGITWQKPIGVTLLGDSRGQAGRLESGQRDNKPSYILTPDNNSVFEFEQYDIGPCIMHLAIDFQSSTIVNHIELFFKDLPSLDSVRLEDIIAHTNTGSLHKGDLFGNREDDFWYYPSDAVDSWRFTFIPVDTKRIQIKLVVESSYLIDTPRGVRKRWALAVEQIKLGAIEFAENGSLGGEPFPVPFGSAVLPVADIWPVSKVFDFVYETQTDGNWVSNKIGRPVLASHAYQWRFGIKSNKTLFDELVSFQDEMVEVKDVKTILTSMSRFESPSLYVLPEVPLNNDVYTIQPQIARVTDKFNDLVTIGFTTGNTQALPLGLNVLDAALDDKSLYINVSVGGEYLYVDEIDDNPSSGSISIGSDGQHLMVHWPDSGMEVSYSLPSELITWSRVPDGFEYELVYPFDADKQQMELFSLVGEDVSTVDIKPGKNFYKLGAKNIVREEFTLLNDDVPWGNAVTSYQLFKSGGADDYYLDHINGILYVKASAPELSAVFSYYKLEKQNNYDIIYEGSVPKRIRVKNVHAFTAAEKRGEQINRASSNIIRYDLHTNGNRTVAAETDNQTMVLSYGNILPGTVKGLPGKELEYINGKSEFSGLKRAREQVGSVQADSGGVLTYQLQAKNQWVRRGIKWNSRYFRTQRSSLGAVSDLGDWYVSTDGLVTLRTQPGLTLPYNTIVTYSYTDVDFEQDDYYSVDYQAGIIYSNFDIETLVEYEYSLYKVYYSVAGLLESQASARTVNIVTEQMLPANNLVRIFYRNAQNSETLGKYKNYFSPLIYSIRHVIS